MGIAINVFECATHLVESLTAHGFKITLLNRDDSEITIFAEHESLTVKGKPNKDERAPMVITVVVNKENGSLKLYINTGYGQSQDFQKHLGSAHVTDELSVDEHATRIYYICLEISAQNGDELSRRAMIDGMFDSPTIPYWTEWAADKANMNENDKYEAWIEHWSHPESWHGYFPVFNFATELEYL